MKLLDIACFSFCVCKVDALTSEIQRISDMTGCTICSSYMEFDILYCKFDVFFSVSYMKYNSYDGVIKGSSAHNMQHAPKQRHL